MASEIHLERSNEPTAHPDEDEGGRLVVEADRKAIEQLVEDFRRMGGCDDLN